MKKPILNKQERWYLKYQPNCTYSAFLRLFLARRRFLRALGNSLFGCNKIKA